MDKEDLEMDLNYEITNEEKMEFLKILDIKEDELISEEKIIYQK